MRPASNASLASLRRFASLATLRYLSSLMRFDALPERIQVLEGVISKRGCPAAGDLLHGPKATPEFRICRSQSCFGVDPAPARKVDDGEEHVAEFLLSGGGIHVVDSSVQFLNLFGQLFFDSGDLGPIEADGSSFFLHALRLKQRGQRLRDS